MLNSIKLGEFIKMIFFFTLDHKNGGVFCQRSCLTREVSGLNLGLASLRELTLETPALSHSPKPHIRLIEKLEVK